MTQVLLRKEWWGMYIWHRVVMESRLRMVVGTDYMEDELVLRLYK